MWNNWRRLHVTGLDARTTSIGESMHGSMKNGTDGVRPAQSAHKSASKMMDKANQKAKKIKKYNAQELPCNHTMNHGDRGNYLTDFSYKYTDNQLLLSKKCRAIQEIQ